ncbi:MAG TPA: gluconokinase [Candidatus Limnocylindrales bacterium]
MSAAADDADNPSMAPHRQQVTTIVVMGVAGAGKSSVMTALAAKLGWPTLEGDDLHPAPNVAKMAAGVPLTDDDRAPWLDAIAAAIGEREVGGSSSVVTCSALRRRYRDVLRRGHPSVRFVHLVAARDELASRMRNRVGHYMPPELLTSQLETLEPLEADEPGSTIETSGTPDEMAERIVAALRLDR